MGDTTFAVTPKTGELGEIFWHIYEHENFKHEYCRFACVALYVVGLAMITVVLAQNFIYVVKMVVATGS